MDRLPLRASTRVTLSIEMYTLIWRNIWNIDSFVPPIQYNIAQTFKTEDDEIHDFTNLNLKIDK